MGDYFVKTYIAVEVHASRFSASALGYLAIGHCIEQCLADPDNDELCHALRAAFVVRHRNMILKQYIHVA